MELDLSANEEKEDQQDDKEGEADDKEEEPDGDSVKNNTPLPCSMKKRCLSATKKKPSSKHLIKCCRFSLPLSSDEETEKEDKFNTTNYTPCKPHHILTLAPSPSHLTGLDGGTSDDDMLDFAGGQPD